MEVILQEDYPQLGYVGDKVNVRRGYARNFLFPQGIAVEASSGNAKLLKHRMRQIHAKKAKLKKEAESRAAEVSSLSLEFKLKVGAQGKSFGSITQKDILEQLAQHGQQLERKQIRLLEPIRMVGQFEVEVKLHSEVSAKVPVAVIAEAQALPKGKKKRKAKADAEDADLNADEGEELAAAGEDDATEALLESDETAVQEESPEEEIPTDAE